MFKNLFLAVLSLTLFVNAQSINWDGSDKNPSQPISNNGYAFTNDTLTDTTTIDTLVNDLEAKSYYDYTLSVGQIIGTGRDSIKYRVVVEALDASGNYMYQFSPDTITDSMGAQIDLKLNKSIKGNSFRIFGNLITGSGSQVVLPDSARIISSNRK